MTEPATDRSPLDLDAIRARYEYQHSRQSTTAVAGFRAVDDIPPLLAEILRLRAELDGEPEPCPLDHSCDPDEPCGCWCHLHDCAIVECPSFQYVERVIKQLKDEGQRLVSAARAEADAFDELVDRTIADANRALAQRDAARAYVALHLSPECQHTNAHDGCDETVVCKGRCWCTCHNDDERDERCLACRNGKHSLCEPGTACACRCLGEERTEPATATGCGRRSVTGDCPDHPLPEPAMGEDDVEVVARLVVERVGRTDVTDLDRNFAADILAALDLPGRERALREEIEELAGELAEERTLHDATNAALAKERAEHERALYNTHKYNTHKRGWNEVLRRNSG